MRWALVLLFSAGCDGFRAQEAAPVPAVASLTLAYQKSCARMSDDTVRCWGNRASTYVAFEQPNTDNPIDLRPRAIPGVGGAVALATDLVHDCALGADGTVTCWNDEEAPSAWSDATGSLGIADMPTGFCFVGPDRVGRAGDYLSALQPVAGATDVVDILANWTSSCVRHTDGTVACGGTNDQGQLGDGTTTDSPTFVPVKLSERAIEVAVGYRFACALGESGSVYCWGANDRGQLGDGTTVPHALPRMLTSLGWANHIVVGASHACASDLNGQVQCWGANDRGQLGHGTTLDRLEPTPVAGLVASAVAAAWMGDHTCAITRAGEVVCWGANDRGELGDGTTTDRTQPVSVAF
jgi:hypothetical protein